MSSQPARPGPRPRYTREQVLETALELIDREPPEAFTMRRVADELGMGVMTLYGYVRNKDEMIEGVTELVLSQLRRSPAAGLGWEELVGSAVRDIYDICRRHPNLATLVLAQATASPGLFRLRERMLGTLEAAGLDEPTALHALGALTSYAVGFGIMQGGAVPIDLPERIAELPSAEFPRLHQAAERYGTHLSNEAFEYGLELLLEGLRGQTPAHRSGRSAT
jgi:AcrR family transcriptional regulator